MPLIHPTFDPAAKVWFHGIVQAPTISALLAKLGPGYEAKDFYRGPVPPEVIAFPKTAEPTAVRTHLRDVVPSLSFRNAKASLPPEVPQAEPVMPPRPRSRADKPIEDGF